MSVSLSIVGSSRIDLKSAVVPFLYFLVVLAALYLPPAHSKDVRVCQSEPSKHGYRMELADLILRKTADSYGAAKVVKILDQDPPQKRCVAMLEQQQVDLLYLGATDENISRFATIKIDIHDRMLGHRVLIIRKDQQEAFSEVATIEDLRRFKGGFGSQWGDFKVFALNNLPVVGVAQTNNLLKMLAAKRFDYFHRGLHEAWREVEEVGDEYPDLVVEKTLVLVYKYPVYFIFHPANTRLKRRFEQGFKIILADGSFKKLFQKNFGHIAKLAKAHKRKKIRIRYPLPEELPESNLQLW